MSENNGSMANKMSEFIYSKERDSLISFSEYLLTEKFEAKKIEYGTEYKDGRFTRKGSSMITMFYHQGNTYFVAISLDNKEFGFTTIEGKVDNVEDILKSNFDRTTSSNAIKVFNHIIYIITQYLEKKRPVYLSFNGFDEKLGKIYSRAVKNKSVIEILKKIDYHIMVQGKDILLVRGDYYEE